MVSNLESTRGRQARKPSNDSAASGDDVYSKESKAFKTTASDYTLQLNSLTFEDADNR